VLTFNHKKSSCICKKELAFRPGAWPACQLAKSLGERGCLWLLPMTFFWVIPSLSVLLGLH